MAKEWEVIGVFSAIAASLHLWYILGYKEAYAAQRSAPPSILMGLTVWLGQGIWMSMDRRRRGRSMGAWRYAVLFLGPLAFWIYLVLEYRPKALLLVPLSYVPYLFVLWVPPLIGVAFLNEKG